MPDVTSEIGRAERIKTPSSEREGGARTNGPWPSWPVFADDERAAVDRVLASGKVNYWTGDECRQFELGFARHARVRHAIALANGTVAMELALKCWGVGAGDDVIVTPRSFIASSSAAVLRGARPVFADVDLESQNITAETIEAAITPRTKAIIAVHLAGWPCDMDAIIRLAEGRRLLVLEDCAQALGAAYRESPVGTFGHAGAFSFCQDKIITTGGEGGMLVTNDPQLWAAAWSYKDHGKSWTAMQHKPTEGGFRWVHDGFGTNWRMTEIQAVIGRAQLGKLEGWVQARGRNAGVLAERLGDLPLLRIPRPPQHVSHAWYRFYVFVRPEELRAGWTRDRLLAEILRTGVPCFTGSCPEIYLEKAFDGTGWRPDRSLPNARMLGETSLAFLVHPTLTSNDMHRICDIVIPLIRQAAR